MTDTTWVNIRKRADELKKKSLEKNTPSEEEKERIFKARAEKLRQKWAKEPDEREIFTCIRFQIRDENYAISAYNINEIFDAEKISFIPCIPTCFAGMTNHRGKPLTVLDLADFFHLPEPSAREELRGSAGKNRLKPGARNKILVIEDGGLCAGILVDRIDGMVELPMSQIKKVSTVLTDKNSCIKSEVLIANRQAHIIDATSLLRNKNLVVDQYS